MSYGHAERTLALIRQLEAEARQLSGNQILPEQEQLPEPAGPAATPSLRNLPDGLQRNPSSHPHISNTKMTGVSQCFPAHAARSSRPQPRPS